MMTTRKPCPAQDQAGPVSGETTLKDIFSSHIHNTSPSAATTVHIRALTHAAHHSARSSSLQIRQTIHTLIDNAERSGPPPEAATLLDTLRAATAGLAAATCSAQGWSEVGR